MKKRKRAPVPYADKKILKALKDYHVEQKTRGDGSTCWICELIAEVEKGAE